MPELAPTVKTRQPSLILYVSVYEAKSMKILEKYTICEGIHKQYEFIMESAAGLFVLPPRLPRSQNYMQRTPQSENILA